MSVEYRLHCGRSKKTIVKVVPDGSGLYRIEWPDIGLSDIANLARCKQAALEWAEQYAMIAGRNLSVAQRLKSLDNFWWSASLVRQKPSAQPQGYREAAQRPGSPFPIAMKPEGPANDSLMRKL